MFFPNHTEEVKYYNEANFLVYNVYIAPLSAGSEKGLATFGFF